VAQKISLPVLPCCPVVCKCCFLLGVEDAKDVGWWAWAACTKNAPAFAHCGPKLGVSRPSTLPARSISDFNNKKEGNLELGPPPCGRRPAEGVAAGHEPPGSAGMRVAMRERSTPKAASPGSRRGPRASRKTPVFQARCVCFGCPREARCRPGPGSASDSYPPNPRHHVKLTSCGIATPYQLQCHAPYR
jgi:hypothetical protein